MKRALTFLVVGAAVASPSLGLAFHAPRGVSSGGLEVAAGVAPLRRGPSLAYDPVPPARRAAWARFLRDAGSSRWRASWDEATGVPSRVFGAGVAAPGSSAAPSVAEAHARAFLEAHADLFAPGLSADDFVLSADELARGMRIVAFTQRAPLPASSVATTVPVVGASVSFRYKNDRLILIASSAVPSARAEAPGTPAAEAASAMLAWIAEQHAELALAGSPELVVLPLHRDSSFEVRTAWHGVVEARRPEARYDVYVDALGRAGATPARIAREQLLRFAQGTVRFDAPVRSPEDARAPYPTPLCDILVDGGQAETDVAGAFTWPGPTAVSLGLGAHGKQVLVQNSAGEPATASFSVDDGGEAVWSLASDEHGDAQLAAFIHTGVVKARVRGFEPEFKFPDQLLTVRVNRDESDYICNAYWDGTATNFFIEAGGCNNTGRLADVVYHEFGHGVHQHAIVPGAGAFDASLSEGVSDYLAATTTGDPVLAPGFFIGGGNLREVDTDRRWPDDIDSDPHETGLIIAGALWDLRTELAAELGDAEGIPIADDLYYQGLRGATDIPSMYPEILAADDDDGDLANGTPHICAINHAFVAHGLTGFVNSAGLTAIHEALSVVAPDEPAPIRLSTSTLYPQCTGDPVESVDVAVTPRPVGSAVTVGLQKQGDDWVGELPAHAQGSALSYRILVNAGGSPFQLPVNAADPSYRYFVGDVRPLYCTDFEDGAEGWTPGAEKGGAGDFAWGEPQGKAGDPASAFSGKRVIGTDLGEDAGDGKYTKNRVVFMDGPAVDLEGEKHVRLQLRRWLTVEDGYFDQAAIYVNGQRLWQNVGTDETNGALDLKDSEWRFEDIDLTPVVVNGATTAQVRFELASDVGTQLGGWNVDDVRLVAWTLPPPKDIGSSGEGGGGDVAPASNLDPGGGCGCEVAGSGGDRSALWMLAAAATALTRLLPRRPRRARRRVSTVSTRG